MAERRRAPGRALLARIARIASLILPLAFVLWWFLLRGRPGDREAVRRPAPAERVEAPPGRRPAPSRERPGREPAAPTPTPGPAPPPSGRAPPSGRVPPTGQPPPSGQAPGIGRFEQGVRRRLEATQPSVTPAPAPPESAAPGIAAFERRVAGRLEATRPRTAPLGGSVRVRLYDVALSGAGPAPFFRAEAILAELDANALNRGGIVATSITLRAPRVSLARGGRDGPWNFERAFPTLAGGGRRGPANGPPISGPLVVLNGVEIRDGRIDVRPGARERYTFLDVDAVVSRAALSVPGRPPEVRVARLTTTASVPDAGRPLALDVRAARLAFPADRVAFSVERAALDGSVLVDVTGSWTPDAPGGGLAATLRADPVQFDELRILVPALPPRGTATFALTIAPLPGGRTALRLRDLVARTPDSRVAGALALAVGGAAGVALVRTDLRLEPLDLAVIERFTGPTGYTGALTGTIRGTAEALTFDVTARLRAPDVAEPFTAGLTGRASFDGAGFALRSADVMLRDVPLAALRPLAPGLPLRGRVSGRVSLRGPPGRVPLALDVALAVAGGRATLVGSLDLTGAEPVYDLSGRLERVQLQMLFARDVPPVALTAAYAVTGRGVALARSNARVSLTGRFTGWETGPADAVRVRATLDAGVVALDTFSVVLGPLTLQAAGRWRFVRPGAGGLRYGLVVRDLEPFGPYLPLPAGTELDGAIRTTGTLSGSLERPRVAGTLEGEAVRYAGWSARSVRAAYRLAFGGPLPELRVRLAARGIETPGAGVYDTATLALDFAEPRFSLTLDAARAGGGAVALATEGDIRSNGTREARVARLELDLDDERWSLARPARIAWGTEAGILIRDFVVREVGGEGRVAIDGRLAPTATAGLRLEIEALPVGEVLGLVSPEPVLTGDLWLDARVFGPADDPRIGAEFRVVGGRFRGVALSSFEGALLYEDLRLETRATGVLDTAGAVDLTAVLPVDLRLTPLPRVRLLEQRSMRVTLTADSASLALAELLTTEVRDAEGRVDARVTLTGTPAQPLLEGAVQVWNGAVTVPALDQRYEEIMADIRLTDRRAVIRVLRARSDGWATASGTLTFAQLTRPVADVRIHFDEFRALGVDDLEDAAVWGDLRIAGELSAPIITGDVTLDDGNIMLPSLDGGAGDGLAAIGEPALTGEGDRTFGALDAVTEPATTSWFDNVILDEVIVEAGDDLWFVTDQLRIQLHGELTLLKLEEDLRVFGTLQGERGTFTMRVGPLVRRFEIRSATVRFFGSPEPNPALDITATRLVLGSGGEPIEITIRVGGTLNAPTVALSTLDGASIPESELLSLLLFGQPSFALGQGIAPGTSVLEEALFGVGSLAELASIELEEALVADLGLPLDFIQIRPVPGAFAGLGAPAIVFGQQLGDEVFLTVNAGLGTLFGPSQSITNAWSATLVWRIDPEWTLVLGIEPVDPGRLFRGIGTAFPVTAPDQQFIVELRRRWTY